MKMLKSVFKKGIIVLLGMLVMNIRIIPTHAETSVGRQKGELTTPGEVTLADAQKVLCAALGIVELQGDELWAADLFDDHNITLENAQIVLKAALNIVKISEVIEEKNEKSAIDYMDLYCKTIDTYEIEYNNIDYMDINKGSLVNLNDDEIEKVADYFAKTKEKEIKLFSLDELTEQGLVERSFMYWGLTKGVYVDISSVEVAESEIIVEGSIGYTSLYARGYKTTFILENGKWVLDKTEPTFIA